MKADRLQKLTKLLSSKVIGGAAGLTPLKMVLIQIGRALLLKPKVLIVGSTFLNMEEIYRNLFLTVILRNLDSSAVLVIGDNLKQHEQYFDKIIHLHRGMISKIVTQQ